MDTYNHEPPKKVSEPTAYLHARQRDSIVRISHARLESNQSLQQVKKYCKEHNKQFI